MVDGPPMFIITIAVGGWVLGRSGTSRTVARPLRITDLDDEAGVARDSRLMVDC